MAALAEIPVIDPTVKHVGVSKLRELNGAKLRDSKDTLVIQDNDTPVAVLLSYDKFMAIQEHLRALFNTIELLTDDAERSGLLSAFRDIKEGRVRSLREIEEELEKENG